MANVFDSASRRPVEEIPPDLTCKDCNKPFTIELAYRGHMAKVHGIRYEARGRTVAAPNADVAALRENAVDHSQAEKLEPWQAYALAQHELYGTPFSKLTDVANRATTLGKLSRSPAGERFRAEIADLVGDPGKLVKMMLDASKLHVTAAWFQAFEWAVEAKDFNAVHRMAKEVGIQDILQSQQKQAPVAGNITVVIGPGAGLDTPQVTIERRELESPEVIEDADYRIE